MTMAQGSKLAFDPKTHRKARKSYIRLRYIYLAAQLIGDAEAGGITQRILEHLEAGLQNLQQARGIFTWNKIHQANVTLSQLEPSVRDKLAEGFEPEKFEKMVNLPLSDLSNEDKEAIIDLLGAYLQNESYRELLLRVISDQWVEYLTKVDALRVSIGLEAYAQRDPLVQYKSKATDMFSELLAEIRMGVISRLFTFQIRRVARSDIEVEREQGNQGTVDETPQGEMTEQTESKKKRKRRRR